MKGYSIRGAAKTLRVSLFASWIMAMGAGSVAWCAEPYEFGHGYTLNPWLTVGGYFSTELELGKTEDKIVLDDVAVLAYGQLSSSFSYLAEFEAVSFYEKSLSDGSEHGDQQFHIERLYGDLWVNEAFNIRFGKQITPIGYWNREPINVLRDTTSSPLYSKLLFPKFLTGIDLNGYLPGTEAMTYHLFAQATNDMEDEYINIPNSHFYGLALEKEISMEWSAGGSVGEYIPIQNGERTRFVQMNVRYENSAWSMLAEGIVAKTDYADSGYDYTYSGYVQGLYRFSPEHALVGRYEYYDRRHDDYRDHIGIVGYSYRPLYPVSLKGEYQRHSRQDENRFLFSFAVLF